MTYFTVVFLNFFFDCPLVIFWINEKRPPTVVFHLWMINRDQPNEEDNYLSFVSIKIKFEAFRSYGSGKLYLIEVKKTVLNCMLKISHCLLFVKTLMENNFRFHFHLLTFVMRYSFSESPYVCHWFLYSSLFLIVNLFDLSIKSLWHRNFGLSTDKNTSHCFSRRFVWSRKLISENVS